MPIELDRPVQISAPDPQPAQRAVRDSVTFSSAKGRFVHLLVALA